MEILQAASSIQRNHSASYPGYAFPGRHRRCSLENQNILEPSEFRHSVFVLSADSFNHTPKQGAL